jgi:hypothetical protein
MLINSRITWKIIWSGQNQVYGKRLREQAMQPWGTDNYTLLMQRPREALLQKSGRTRPIRVLLQFRARICEFAEILANTYILPKRKSPLTQNELTNIAEHKIITCLKSNYVYKL